MTGEEGINDGKEEMLTPKEAMEMLRTYGTIVSEQEAKEILDYMVTFGRLTLSIYENCRPLHPGEH